MIDSDRSGFYQDLVRWVYLAVLILLLVAPWFVNPYKVHVLNTILINIVAVLALNLVMGYSGQFAKANVAFMGLGAYSMGIMVTRLDMSFWIAWPLGALFAALAGTLIALPTVRLKGLYLAIMSISFVLIVHWGFIHIRGLTGGASGFSVPTPNFGLTNLPSGYVVYYLSIASVLAALWVTRNLVASNFGRALLCISEREIIAPGFGIHVFRLKITVYAISGLLAGFAGGLQAVNLNYLDPENYWILQVVNQLLMVALGGVSSILGSVLGASFVTILIEALRGFKGLWEFAIGTLLLVTIIFLPRGLISLVERFFPGLREKRHGP